jgi:NAD(P)-dependent dehydrogenase (short-subunit alcohol dehydrogenase family)
MSAASRRFEGRSAIVTGGGRGIGEAVARRLASEGAAVLLVARGEAEIEQVAASIRAEGGSAVAHVADVSREADVQGVADAAEGRFGSVDVLVNNAGIDDDCPFLEVRLERWQEVVGVNLTGPFLMSQRIGRLMARDGGGAIVHIASIDAHGADGEQVAYNASKAGLLGLNRTMAVELAPHGIRCNVVNPGYTATPLTRKYVGEAMYDYMTSSFARIPQGRMATPEEIAAAVAFLACDDAAAITGTDLTVDGGTLANIYVVETLPAQGA